MVFRLEPGLIAVALLLGCGADTPQADDALADDTPGPAVDTPPEPPAAPTPLDPAALLTRASLDLRGVRPTIAELRAVLDGRLSTDAAIERFLADERLGGRVREVFDEVWWIRDEAPFVDLTGLPAEAPIEGVWEAIGEEPTRMLERITTLDLPYSAFVTADWTVANEVSALLLPLDYPAGAQGWRLAHYTDGRPAAGVLASSGLWWQHGSTVNNHNRGRANQISRVLLCYDYLDSEIDFAGVTTLTSEASLGDAIRDDPSCAACHVSLDPLASSLYGFWFPQEARSDFADIRAYHPEREALWSDYGGPPPAFRGAPIADLAALGDRIAADPAYARCFVQRSWEGLLRRKPEAEDQAALTAAVDAFVASGLRVRDAWRAIVQTDAWRNGAGERAPKITSPALLSSEIEDLTGFVWTEGGWDLLRGPLVGYGTPAGGVDGNLRASVFTDPTVTLALVQGQVAAMAASYAATHDLDDPAGARLLTRVRGDERLPDDEDALRAQLVDLHLRITGEEIDAADPAIDAELALWGELRAAGPARVAWTAILTVLLRDPRVITY